MAKVRLPPRPCDVRRGRRVDPVRSFRPQHTARRAQSACSQPACRRTIRQGWRPWRTIPDNPKPPAAPAAAFLDHERLATAIILWGAAICSQSKRQGNCGQDRSCPRISIRRPSDPIAPLLRVRGLWTWRCPAVAQTDGPCRSGWGTSRGAISQVRSSCRAEEPPQAQRPSRRKPTSRCGGERPALDPGVGSRVSEPGLRAHAQRRTLRDGGESDARHGPAYSRSGQPAAFTATSGHHAFAC